MPLRILEDFFKQLLEGGSLKVLGITFVYVEAQLHSNVSHKLVR